MRTCVFCFHTSQQPLEFRGCSQKLNMCDLTTNIADPPELRRVSPNRVSISKRIADASLLRSLQALRSAMETNLNWLMYTILSSFLFQVSRTIYEGDTLVIRNAREADSGKYKCLYVGAQGDRLTDVSVLFVRGKYGYSVSFAREVQPVCLKNLGFFSVWDSDVIVGRLRTDTTEAGISVHLLSSLLLQSILPGIIIQVASLAFYYLSASHLYFDFTNTLLSSVT